MIGYVPSGTPKKGRGLEIAHFLLALVGAGVCQSYICLFMANGGRGTCSHMDRHIHECFT